MCLLGKVLSSKAASREGLEQVVTSVWLVSHKVQVEQIGANTLFMLHFCCTTDRYRVLASGPWLFEKQIISLCQANRIRGDFKYEF